MPQVRTFQPRPAVVMRSNSMSSTGAEHPGNSSYALSWHFGRVTSLTAELLVRLHVAERKPPAEVLTAAVSGPRSLRARTLETTVSMSPVDDDGLLWRAVLEDPCFWTPGEPYLYAAQFELRSDDGRPQTLGQPLGVPVLVARGDKLELEGKNWVVRGAQISNAAAALAACRDSSTALYVDDPNDALCHEASRQGVLLIANLCDLPERERESPDRAQAALRRLARWPATGIVLLPNQVQLSATLRGETAHVIRGAVFDASSRPPDWAQLLVVAAADVVKARTVAAGRAVMVRSRPLPPEHARSSDEPALAVARARQSCDSLQAELAPVGQFAGYLVG